MEIYTIPDNLKEEIDEYEKMINEFENGKIDKQKLRAYRVPMGVYEQRTDDTYMVRIRIPGGNISVSQFDNLINIGKKYLSPYLHITTREEIQLHNIQLRDTVKIMKDLLEINLSTRGGGGNTVRNIIGSWDSGINKNEIFDITPYVVALTERMIKEKDSWNLPRKFKIAFSNGPDDSGLATVNDLGFIAKINENGQRGFKVFIGGGMGANSNIGIKLFDFVPDKEVYNITKAAKILFDKYGNRKNKHKARLRFVLYNLGEEEFIKRFLLEYEEVKKQNYPELKLKKLDILYKNYIEIPIFLGDLSFDNAKKIISIAKKFGEFSLRLTPRQNILIKNIPDSEIENVKKELKENGLLEDGVYFLKNAISCAGASTCRLGICLSKNLIKAIKNKFDGKNLKLSTKLNNIKINISGCPNSCGQHHLADIGFFGKAKKVNGFYAPYYYVVAGANINENKSKFAEKLGELPAKNVPDFLEEFLLFVDKNKKTDESFYSFYTNKGKERIIGLINKYNEIPYFEENKFYYYDWGEEKQFSVLEKIEGECSAGLFDLIDYDFKMAEENIKSKDYKKAIAFTSHALLITKGIETKTDIESVVLFKTNFIGKHIDKKYEDILNRFISNESNFLEDEVLDFFKNVKNLYSQMDNSLHFPEIKQDDIKKENTKKYEILIKDFRGVPCPLNFVKVKLELEKMQKGEKLKIYLDDGEPIENVPASLKAEGHKILETLKNNNFWEVLIEKGV